jgi:hypothetical protein
MGADREPAYYSALHEFNPKTCREARPRSRQLILVALALSPAYELYQDRRVSVVTATGRLGFAWSRAKRPVMPKLDTQSGARM